MARRFRGFLPVVVDVETGGFNHATDALLEIAAVLIDIDADGSCGAARPIRIMCEPFENARLDPASLQVNRIDPWHPLRPAHRRGATRCSASSARYARAIRQHGCRRAMLVGHNAAFDLAFSMRRWTRTGLKRNPFHPFSCFDTATLAGAALGQTVLAKAMAVAGLSWDKASAHSATYDAERTADLFCLVCNELTASFARAEKRALELGFGVAAPVADSYSAAGEEQEHD